MGLTDGLIRFSIGLDNDIERTYQSMNACMKELDILSKIYKINIVGFKPVHSI